MPVEVKSKKHEAVQTEIEVKKSMISQTIVVESLNNLKEYLAADELENHLKTATSVFIQIYLPEYNPDWAMRIESVFRTRLPDAVIAGGSSMGGIAKGEMDLEFAVISVTFFAATRVTGFIVDGSRGAPAELGKLLQKELTDTCQEVAGIMLLATTSNMNIDEFLTGFLNTQATYPIFGGGTGAVASADDPLVFLNSECLSQGVVAVAFMGTQIEIEAHTYLGWQALSKEMVVTEADGLWVKKIDDKPAFEVYQHYLGIQNDDNFFFNAIEFPFLLKKDGIEYAKSPSEVNSENAIKFFADIKEGDAFRIGYGNPQAMIEQAQEIQMKLENFNPEAIFLYSCSCRRFLLLDDVNLETKPFETLAPTFGYYTFGEIHGSAASVHILNATMVAVGMREFKAARKNNDRLKKRADFEPADPLVNRHSCSISRLVNFIQAVTDELEETNREAHRLAERDYLTNAYNRIKVKAFLDNEMKRSHRYGTKFSIIILDMDLFKAINDEHGHNVGDLVLSQAVEIVDQQMRESDILSRWGGEEFLIVLPETGISGAIAMAERIRKAMAETSFAHASKQTCSLGVTMFRLGEHIEETIDRADKALYEAKNRGRNCVVAK